MIQYLGNFCLIIVGKFSLDNHNYITLMLTNLLLNDIIAVDLSRGDKYGKKEY